MAVYRGSASKCVESGINFFSNKLNIDLKEVVRSFTSTSGCWRLKEPLPATTFSSKRAGTSSGLRQDRSIGQIAIINNILVFALQGKMMPKYLAQGRKSQSWWTSI